MNTTYNKQTQRQLREENNIFESMNRRKLSGIKKRADNSISDLDVMINDDIAMLQAEYQIWNLHADENIVVDVDVKYCLN